MKENGYEEAAWWYDTIFKDKPYDEEIADIFNLLQQYFGPYRVGKWTTAIDVACGTGRHDMFLPSRFTPSSGGRIVGLDIDRRFLDMAERRNNEFEYVEGDMAEPLLLSALGESFDLVLCLFNAVGYLVTVERLQAAIKNFSQLVRRHGVIVIEPWYEPETWTPYQVNVVTAQDDSGVVARMGIGQPSGSIHFDYLIGTPEGGIEHFCEYHEKALFSQQQFAAAFAMYDLIWERVPAEKTPLFPRGLYLAQRR